MKPITSIDLMLIISLIHGRNVVIIRQGVVLPIMVSTNELFPNVNINLAHISYPKYFGVELCRVAKG